MSLASQFAAAGGIVLIIAALLVGAIVSRRIEESVVRNTASATALYMESFVSPISQQLADSDQLSVNAKRALNEIFTDTPLGERVVSYKIWKQGGRIVEASDPALIGQVFPVNASLRAAWDGQVRAEFDDVEDAESAAERRLDVPLLEVYSPIRKAWTGEVIAVAEFYEANPQLGVDLADARRAAWATVIGVMLGIGGALYLIVLRGSRTIDRQKAGLDAQFREMTALSGRNSVLRRRVQQAAARASAGTEQALRRISADLHDGPAQYLAFAALRLDGLRDRQPDDAARAEMDAVKQALDQAMGEVRSISRGLALPDIVGKPVCTVLRMAVDAHVARSGHPVALACDGAEQVLPSAVTICVFRFAQEGLNNATRHGGGEGMQVALTSDGATLSLSVRDAGPGFGDAGVMPGLGLSGLRDRVESLGGSFTAASRPEGGSEITMMLDTGEHG